MLEKLFPNPFLKTQNWACLWINSLKFYIAQFYCVLSWGLLKYIEINSWSLAFVSRKAFLKNKTRSGISSPASFSAWFLEENISLVILYINWPNFVVYLVLLCGILSNVCCNCLLTRLWRHKFWNCLIFLIKSFFLHNRKSRQKFKYFENEKSF